MQIVVARPADLDAVMALLREARGWHQEKGVDVWREFDAEPTAADIAAEHVYIACEDDVVYGTITLVESGARVWDGDDGQALYVRQALPAA